MWHSVDQSFWARHVATSERAKPKKVIFWLRSREFVPLLMRSRLLRQDLQIFHPVSFEEYHSHPSSASRREPELTFLESVYSGQHVRTIPNLGRFQFMAAGKAIGAAVVRFKSGRIGGR
jgi:hypothetical protein